MLGAPGNVVIERLGHAVLELVAARAGCEVMQPNTDYTSIDAMIKPVSGIAGAQIDVQIKGSTGLKRDANGLKFPLKIKNYNDLRTTNVLIPRMLVIADLSDLETEWLTCNQTSLTFKNSIYWTDLHGRPEVTNKSTVTIDIPFTNVLSANILADLVQNGEKNIRSGKGGLI